MRTGLWIAAAVAGLGAAGTLVAATELMQRSEAREVPSEHAAAPARRVVMVTPAHFESARSVRHLPGTIAARTVSDLGFRVPGKLLARTVEAGDAVRAGDVVALLDATDLRLQAEAAAAERAAARIALDKAEVNLARVASLQARGWASGQASDAETVAVEEARARLLQAERNAELARNQLGYATLHADADGVVTGAFAEPGQVLAAGQSVVRLAHDGAREAVVAIPESMLAEIRSAEAAVELWSAPGTVIRATLRELSPIADPASRTFEARYALDTGSGAAAGSVALGLSVTVALARTDAEASAKLPLSALFDDGHGPLVWVVGAEGALEARPVAVADYAAGNARVVDGLAEGERVVVLGAHKLRAGEPVRAVETEG